MAIWVNPACSKCRSAVSMLDAAGAEYTVRRYLEDPPSAAELTAVLDRLGLEPWDITRTTEPVAKELGLRSWPRTPADRHRWIDALAAHPKLIQPDHHRRRRHDGRGPHPRGVQSVLPS
jgi:arsenate reductase